MAGSRIDVDVADISPDGSTDSRVVDCVENVVVEEAIVVENTDWSAAWHCAALAGL